MSNVPTDRKYAKSHEWLKIVEGEFALVGITDYAQNSLGDITFVQLPKVGAKFKAGDPFGVVESVKAASDVYLPATGTIVEINPVLEGSPEKINQAPYTDGWMIKLKLVDPVDLKDLLDPAAYQKAIGS